MTVEQEEERAEVFRPSSASMFVFAALSAAAAVAVAVLEDRLLGSGRTPLAAVLAVTALIPLARAAWSRKRYVVRVAATWMSGPGKKEQLTLSREQVLGLKRQNGKLVIEATDGDPILIPLRYYRDTFRLESAIHGFVHGVRPWILRRTPAVPSRA